MLIQKRENYRKAFAGFNAKKVAAFTSKSVERLLLNAGIVRNRLKIEATINNAQRFLEVQKEFGSFGSVHRLVGKMGSFLLRFGKNTQFVTEQIESDATENDGGLNLVMSHPCQNLYLYFTYFTNHPVNATKNFEKNL